MLKRPVPVFFRDITTFGSGFIYGMICISILIWGNTELFMRLFIGAALIHIIIIIIRLIHYKQRPTHITYRNILERIDSSSFPSAHSALGPFLLFNLAALFNNSILTGCIIVLSMLVAYSRVYLKKHFFIDIVAGYSLGVIIYYIITMVI